MKNPWLASALSVWLSACAGVPAESPVQSAYHVDSDSVLSRIAFGSCLSQDKPQPIWRAIIEDDPDLFLMMGDNVYADYNAGGQIPNPHAGMMGAAYAKQASHPDFRAAAQAFPMLAIWDDHDYGWNDAGAEFAYKDASKAAFINFFALPASAPVRGRPGLYQALTFGPPGRRVQILLLDLRWFRSPLRPTDQRGAPGKERYRPDPDPAKTLLGEAQWAWLAKRLQEQAELRLLVSPIQLIAEGHGWERWGNLPTERARFYRLIEESGAENLVVLSGDRHFAGLYRRDTGLGAPLIEATASSLNLSFAATSEEQGPHQLGPLYGGENFGLLEIDWEKRRLRLTLKDASGRARRDLTIEFDPR